LIAWALDGYGRAFTDTDPGRALIVLREGLVYAQEHRLSHWESLIARDAANLEAAHGERDRALAFFDNAIDSFLRAGNIASVAATLADLAVAFDRTDSPEIAVTLYGSSTHHSSANRVMNLRDDLEHLRAGLGETVFDRCVATGAAMELADAVAYARGKIREARHRQDT
jgi:hypothetical protein